MSINIPEAREIYRKAKRKGIKNYSSHISQGESGYVPFLEGVLKNRTIVSEVNLRINEIPMSKIKGTYTKSRSLAFSANFLPLMDEDTEFYDKWINVAMAHMNEGLRDPIKVYEYLNWFYVIEGNKRVSVLKYYDVYSFRAEVIRLVPKYDPADKTIRIYYEFLDFYNKTNVMSMWFSKENNFNTMFQYMDNYTPDNNIHKNKYIAFEKDIYIPFRKIFHSLDSDKLKITTGDALLEYIKLYGIPSVDEMIISDKIEKRISNLIPELTSLYDKDKITISTKDSKESSIVSQVTSFLKPKRNLKVAFLYPKDIESSNWSYSHELGRIHVQNKFKDSIKTDIYQNIPESKKAYEHIKKIAKENYDVIFATSPAFIKSTLKVAIDFQDTTFFNCSQSYSFKHLTTYFGRIYEPRFLAGVIAGSMTSTNIIGYVGSFPIPEIICSINAFALGAKLVNPNAKVHVEWLNKWDPKDGSNTVSNDIVKAGADIILHNATIGKNFKGSEYGLYTLICDVDSRECIPDNYLASPIWNWGMFYEKILSSVINNSFKYINSVSGSNKKQVNFWWGMDTGVVDLVYSKRLIPSRTQKLVDYIKNGLSEDSFFPFEGPISDREGNIRVNEGERASIHELLSMTWFVDNVDTKIPESTFVQPDSNLFTGKIE